VIPARVDGPDDAAWTLVLGHGAGAPMDSPFLETVAGGLAGRGHRVVRFEFPYMRRRRDEGTRRPPDRLPVLLDALREVVAQTPARRLALGGKSLGGRVASLLADELGADALVVLGYPFHPPGRPERTRTEHLGSLRTPTLILQGERDPFGARGEVEGYALSRAIRVVWVHDGDHGLAPRRASGRTEADNLGDAVAAIDAFLRARSA
jgi:predicted alpha/beta-hydrolase family hydrolase